MHQLQSCAVNGIVSNTNLLCISIVCVNGYICYTGATLIEAFLVDLLYQINRY